ncbi:hypothetical protein [Paenibacillus periandrae]|uniref:hypothetical protein n=1 Tax=Paenibacillus periandrae TaxID=1761741 RepID=UPI001F09982C|nr:hypothetical protein [Paenibacillus periandrae]
MKKFVLSILSALFLTTSIITGGASAASNDTGRDQALQTANAYFQDIIKSSADGQMGIPLKSFTIVATDSSNEDDIKLSVQLTYDEFGTLPVAPYSVVKKDGKYSVKHDIITFNSDPKSSEYGTVKVGNAVNNQQKAGMSINSDISGSFYSSIVNGTPAAGSYLTTYFSGQSFTNTQTNITINGWQTKNSGTDIISLAYGIAAKLSGGNFNNLSTSSFFDGDIPSSGTWLSAYLSGVTTGSDRCIFVSNRSYSRANVSGNAYQ